MKFKSLLLLLVMSAVGALAQSNRILPSGSTIKVRTDTAIPAKLVRGASYTATVSEDVKDSSGAILIPKGAKAQLVATSPSTAKDPTLDLRSVTINNQRFLVTTATSSASSRPGGLGANKRTGMYVGGGAAAGAVLGALVGGGRAEPGAAPGQPAVLRARVRAAPVGGAPSPVDLLAGPGAQVFKRIKFVQMHVASFHGEFSARRHGVAGIDCQVQDHLLNLAGIGLHSA